MNALAVALVMVATLGVGLSMGLATGKAVESVARQPEASGKINAILLLGLALAESVAIYCLVIALILVTKL